jgi:hypothetical protein
MSPVRMAKKLWLGAVFLAAALLLGCALPVNLQPSQVSVWARSHNRSTVDVYLLCSDRDPHWLGVLRLNDARSLDFPATRARCMQGLNFFLVDREHNHGYWVGPMHLQSGSRIELVIERYAGLSTASLGR